MSLKNFGAGWTMVELPTAPEKQLTFGITLCSDVARLVKVRLDLGAIANINNSADLADKHVFLIQWQGKQQTAFLLGKCKVA